MGAYGQPPPAPYPQPVQAARPTRSGGGFLAGCFAGACLVIVLEVLGVCGATALLGVAANRAISSFQSSLGVIPSSEPCSPQPCLARSGLQLGVTNIRRSAGPAAAVAGTPDPTLHRVRLDITYTSKSGDHELDSLLTLKDISGASRAPASSPDCSPQPSGTLPAGKSLGPIGLCFDVSGKPADTLTLQWLPVEAQGFFQLEVKLP